MQPHPMGRVRVGGRVGVMTLRVRARVRIRQFVAVDEGRNRGWVNCLGSHRLLPLVKESDDRFLVEGHDRRRGCVEAWG